MDKAPDAYRTISEVADELDLPQHVLRFWETRFAQIRPLKRGGGRRYYRPEDIDLLRGIRHLLYGQGYTIRGVQRIIKESGVKAIQALGRGEGLVAPAKPGGPEIVAPADEEERRWDDRPEADHPPANRSPADLAPADPPRSVQPRSGLAAGLRGLFAGPVEPLPRTEPPLVGERDRDLPAPPSLAAEPVGTAFDNHFDPPQEPPEAGAGAAPAGAPLPPVGAGEPLPASPPSGTRMAAARALRADEVPVAPAPGRAQPLRFAPAVLPPEDVRRLQAALYELSECRRRLDDVLEGA